MHKYIYLIDGDCTMCNRLIVWILSKRLSDDIYFYPLQNVISKEFLHTYGVEDGRVFESSYLVAGNEIDVKSRAFFKITKRLKMPYRLLYQLTLIPSPISDLFYDYLAKYRWRIFGRQKETCKLATENYSQFLLTDDEAERLLKKVNSNEKNQE